METKISKEELVLLINALENREFKYKKIKDIHRYLLEKLDECSKTEKATDKETKLQPASDLFKGKV